MYTSYPDITDASGAPLPPPPGGGKIIVVKETGETVTMPNLPTESVIALFRSQREAQG